MDDPWKQTSPTGAAQASDFSKSRMAAGGIAAGTLGTGVGAAGTSAFDDQSESSTRAMKSDDGNDMIHVYDEGVYIYSAINNDHVLIRKFFGRCPAAYERAKRRCRCRALSRSHCSTTR